MTVGFLADYGKDDTDQVGGKGANLGELLTNGFPIPPGFVVCADEYAKAISSLGPATAHEEYRSAILGWEFPDDLVDKITRAHESLQADRTNDIVYAVRSSATAEDLGDASFAGQHETFYYVTLNNLIPMIRNCWASLWSEEAIAYRTTQGIEHSGVYMAVVVQEMIPSDVSGITFTANPLTGSTDEVVTDASWGMGAAIVDGRVTPDHYVVLRDNRLITTHKISNKHSMVSSTRLDDGNRMLDVPQHLRLVPCLDDDAILEVAEWGLKAEAHFGSPQDLEWAIHDGRYYMLQSRPITTLLLEDEEESEKRKLVIFKAFAENFTEPLLPLTQDVLSDTSPTTFYRGRVYQEINMIKGLLPIKMTDEEAAELLSWELPEDFRIRVNWLMIPVSLIIWSVIYLFLGVLQARSRAMPDDFMDGFRELVRKVDNDGTLSPKGAMIKLFFGAGNWVPVGHYVMPLNVTAVVRYFALMGLLNKLLHRWVPDAPRDAGSLLCSGTRGVMSTEMGRAIFRLSVTARENPVVVEIFQTYKPDDVHRILKSTSEATPFLRELDQFLSVHGHRALKEFEMAVPRFEESTTPVLAMIKNYLGSESNPDEMEQHTTDQRVALAESVQEKLAALPLERALGLRWRAIEYLAHRTRYFIKLRENSRFFHIMAWNSARKKIIQTERRLLREGKLKVRNDIFYLKWVEVRAMLEDKCNWADVEEIIRKRRMQVIRWTNQGSPKLVNIESTREPKHRHLRAGQLGGQGASPGQYEGIARVIMDPSQDAELHPGEVLVAPYTDPAWTPLFLVARAAVVGVGSYLSHAGTIAREYGMPCVVDVDDCTSKIKTGDRVLVDGTEGIVHLLSKGEEQ